VVDKRGVRRDHADIFCTLQEGVRGQRAVDWKLVDAIAPRSKFEDVVGERARALASQVTARTGAGVVLRDLEVTTAETSRRYKYVTLDMDRNRRTATLTVRGPEAGEPETPEALRERGSDTWSLRAFRELDDALLYLRFNEDTLGVVLLKSSGDPERVLAADRVLDKCRSDWFAREILLYQARVLRRLDLTARTFFALIEPGSCFAGSLFELVLASDRSYVLDDAVIRMALGPLNAEDYPMTHGLSRLEAHFSGDEARVESALYQGAFNPAEADAAGLVTARLDDIDYEDEVRVAIEERASLSPDALTGMEASLRFPGLETADAKIFGRLSAWQNWIFFRPNAVGEHGALKVYGKPERASFDWKRT
jgi:benzoyl-CoA-dihydrodiol lyase